VKDDAGTYRSLSTRLFDEPGYQRGPSVAAKLVYLTLRGCGQRGLAGIWRFYLGVLVDQVHPLTSDQVVAALEELERDGSIRWDREASVLWVVEALSQDRSISLSNKKHVTAIERELHDLPESKLITEFLEHYGVSNQDA
jgi:hypothetical protein